MYLYHNDMLPELFNNYFQPVTAVHNYKTRNSSNKNYYVYPCSSISAKKSLSSNGAAIWNAIKFEIKQCTFYSFKKQYKNQLLEFYSKN